MPTDRDRRKDAKPGTDGTKPGFWRGVGRGIYNTLPKPGDWRNWRQFLDIVSEPWVPGNLYDSEIGGTVGQNVSDRAGNAWDRVTGLFGPGYDETPDSGRGDYGPPTSLGSYTAPGVPLPNWMNPNAPMPGANESRWDYQLPYQDQTYAGPGMFDDVEGAYGSGQGMFPMPQAPRGPVGPSRNNTTIAEGQGAIDWARGLVMANSGLNASGGSFDELNRRARRMQR